MMDTRTKTWLIGTLGTVCAMLAATTEKLPFGEWTGAMRVVFTAIATGCGGWAGLSKPKDKAELQRLRSIRPPPPPGRPAPPGDPFSTRLDEPMATTRPERPTVPRK